ncbi:hypothetical protein MSAN_02108800 [Mycena sanguinolenta]|uniref:Uncharacterized protein n=1 Tax=Mycena sanguinolenta TaxID=230812 RepID=A0A8H7CLX6_9AGAR|nr:hypothetical protein MSAN_02108800 [Mycena sanguinolenta]
MAWSCVIATGATTQMAVTIATAVEAAHLVENLLHAQASNYPTLILLKVQDIVGTINNFATDSLFVELCRCYVIWGCRYKILILPGILMVFTVVLGLVGANSSTGPSITKPQSVYGFAAATNLVLTALTAGRILWIRRTASFAGVNNSFRARCNRALGLILESGLIYCITAIFLVVTASLDAPEVYAVELGVVSQLLNTIPTFTLVYVGLDNTIHKSNLGNNPEAPLSRGTASRFVAAQRSQSTGVLDIS